MSGYDWTHARGFDDKFDEELARFADELASAAQPAAGSRKVTAIHNPPAQQSERGQGKGRHRAPPDRARRARPGRPAGLGPRLTPAAWDLLRVLAQLANDGEVAPTKAELSTRIGRHMDTVRRALRHLEAEDFIDTQHRAGPRPDCDRPSIYRILPLGWAWLGRGDRMSPTATGAAVETAAGRAGAVKRAMPPRSENMRHPSESESDSVEVKMSAPGRDADGVPGAPASLSLAEPPTRAADSPELPETSSPIHVARQAPRGGASSGSKAPTDRPRQGRRMSGEGAAMQGLAARAVAALSARGAFLGRFAGPLVSPWSALAYLRRTELSKFNGAAWSRAVETHGETCCLLAAALVMLRARSADGREIDARSRASYLGGILRVENPNPAASLRFILGEPADRRLGRVQARPPRQDQAGRANGVLQ